MDILCKKYGGGTAALIPASSATSKARQADAQATDEPEMNAARAARRPGLARICNSVPD
jgi:hypothetical protein